MKFFDYQIEKMTYYDDRDETAVNNIVTSYIARDKDGNECFSSASLEDLKYAITEQQILKIKNELENQEEDEEDKYFVIRINTPLSKRPVIEKLEVTFEKKDNQENTVYWEDRYNNFLSMLNLDESSYLESVSCHDLNFKDCVLYIDESGKLKSHEINILASFIYNPLFKEYYGKTKKELEVLKKTDSLKYHSSSDYIAGDAFLVKSNNYGDVKPFSYSQACIVEEVLEDYFYKFLASMTDRNN